MGCFVSEFVDHNSLKWKKLGPFSFNKAVFRSYQFSTLIAENHSLPVIQDYEIYVHGFFFFVSTSKVFRKILIFLTSMHLPAHIPVFFLHSGTEWSTLPSVFMCVGWGVSMSFFLSHWDRISWTRTSSEFAYITVHVGWLIIEVPFQKGQTGKQTSLQLCNAHMGKPKPLCLCCFSKQGKICPLRGDRSL